jgi:hypothetical protein
LGEDIIRSQAEIEKASSAVLVNTYNALTGKNIKKFENRAIAETKVTQAIMSAQDQAGHLGVPKGQEAQVLTHEEREKIAASKGIATGESESEASSGNGVAPAAAKPAKEPKEPKVKRERAKKVISRVVATGAGKSRPQIDSVRGQVLATIQASPGGAIDFADLEKKFGDKARGCVMKLLEKEHIKLVE